MLQLQQVNHWRCVLLVYRELDVKLPLGGWRKRRFHHLASTQEIADAVWSFEGFPDLVRDLTNHVAAATCEVVQMDQPLRSLSKRNEEEWWPSPDDTRAALDQYALPARRDSVFVLWPQHDFARGVSVPCQAWGLGMGASDWSNGATYAAVANAPSSAWREEARGEVWLHEWLHGVCHHFTQRGLTMPERDADGAELHGYTRSPTHGWCEYYRDLMSGSVVENGATHGIPLAAWKQAAAVARSA